MAEVEALRSVDVRELAEVEAVSHTLQASRARSDASTRVVSLAVKRSAAHDLDRSAGSVPT